MDASLPDRPWDLSAPESLALLWGPETGDTWALSLAFLELTVQHYLTLRTLKSRRLGIFPTKKLILAGRVEPSRIVDEPIKAVWKVEPYPWGFSGGVWGIPVAAVTDRLLGPAAVKAAGPAAHPGSVYMERVVLPSLVQRGLYTYLLASTSSVPTLTYEGDARLAELQKLLACGRRWIADPQNVYPTEALDYLARAGSAVLLLRGLVGVYRMLVRRFGQPSSWSLAMPSISSTASETGTVRPPITVEGLTRAFGPNPDDDFDDALYAITTEVDRQWAASYRRVTVTGTGE